MRFAHNERRDSSAELDKWPSRMFANRSIETSSACNRASGDAMRDGGIFAILRAAALISLLFGALAFGLGAGITWSGDLSAPDQGLMDFPY